MVLCDYIFIGLIALSTIIGLALGFGKTLKFMTKGIVGVIICGVLAYLFVGFFYNLGFVQNLLIKFTTLLESKNSAILDFLLKIKIDLILLGVVLFIIFMIVRSIITAIIDKVMSADNVVLKVINKTLGVALNLAVMLALVLLVMQICVWADISQAETFLIGSFFKLDEVYANNPLMTVIEYFKK